jgi:prephenate dehydratase
MSIKYAYLGPAGTFTEAALLKIAAKDDQLIAYANVTAALDAVRKGECAKALVPIENSVEGVVARTLDELASGEPLVITAETTLPVSFSLMTLDKTDIKDIKSIATHPHAESQCRSYIAKNFPNAQVIETASTAAAAKGLSKGDYDAAIAGDEKTINVHVSHLRDKVEPDPNKPRFVLTVRGVGYSFSDRSDRGERSGA